MYNKFAMMITVTTTRNSGMIGSGLYPELLLIGLDQLLINTLVASASTATSNVSSSQAWGDYMSNVIDYDYDYLLAL